MNFDPKIGQTYCCYVGDTLYRQFYVLNVIDTKSINGSYVKVLNLVDNEKSVTIRTLISQEWVEHIVWRYRTYDNGRIHKQE